MVDTGVKDLVIHDVLTPLVIGHIFLHSLPCNHLHTVIWVHFLIRRQHLPHLLVEVALVGATIIYHIVHLRAVLLNGIFLGVIVSGRFIHPVDVPELRIELAFELIDVIVDVVAYVVVTQVKQPFHGQRVLQVADDALQDALHGCTAGDIMKGILNLTD